MEGTTLKQYPVFHTTFKEFKIQYPKGVLLDKSKKGLKGSHYDSYFKDKTKLGILGRIDNFNRFQAKEKIFGLRLENVEVAISKVYLKKHKYWVINTDKSRVIIHYNSDSETARAFYLPPGAQTNDDIAVTNNTILLRDKGNVWSFSTGNVIQGNGLALRPVPVITAFWFAWVSFFPQTILIKGQD